MGDSSLQEIKKTWKERDNTKRREERMRRERARDCAEKVALFLKDNYYVTDVYLYGSLVWGKHFTVHSDIAILVVGFPPRADYWAALARAEHTAAPFPISIALAEKALPGLVEKAIKEGIRL